MKKVIAGFIFTAVATVAYANCTTHTINSGGRMMVCTTCCYGGNCTTNCF